MGWITGHLTNLLEHYGYVVLFFSLMLELIALPLPGELLMTYAGLIVYQGYLNWALSILAAGLGSCVGMTVSYWIGYRLGIPFFEKYGRRVHFGPEKLQSVSRWYERYGNRLLLVAYFIPGVRHLTGVFSGTTRQPFRKYAAFAFSGAILWVTVFISLGRLFGPKWEKYHHTVNRYMLIIGVMLAVVYACTYVYRSKKNKVKAFIVRSVEIGIARFHSMGKVRFVVIGAFAFLVLFTTLLIGLIQDFLAHEFVIFDEVTEFAVSQMFDRSWISAMNDFAWFGSRYPFIAVFVLTGVWITIKGTDRGTELAVLAFAILAGEGLNELLRLLFHRVGPDGGLTFPSGQAMLGLTIYGFAAYLLFRHYGTYTIRFIATLGVIAICLAVGVSLVFLRAEYASDVVGGYVFGGVWLSLNVILLEVLRTIRGFNAD